MKDRRKILLFICLIFNSFILSSIFVGGGSPQKFTNHDFILVWGDSAVNTPQYVLGNNTNDFTAMSNFGGDLGADIEEVIIAQKISSEEKAIAVTDTARDLNVYTWDGTSFTNIGELTTSLGTTQTSQDDKTFDLDYETLSGDLLVVYGDNSDNDYFHYDVYNGNSFQGQSQGFSLGSGTMQWLELESNPETDDMILVAKSDIGVDGNASAYVWNGSEFTNEQNLGLVNDVRSRPFDASWLNSTLAIVAWDVAGSTGGEDDKIHTIQWDGSNWINQINHTNTSIISGDLQFIELESSPSIDKIRGVAHENAGGYIFEFNSSLDIVNFTLSNTDTSLDTTTFMMDIVFYGDTDQWAYFYIDTLDPYYLNMSMDPSDEIQLANVPGADQIKAVTDRIENYISIAYVEGGNDLHTILWDIDAGTFSSDTEHETGMELSSAFDIQYNQYEGIAILDNATIPTTPTWNDVTQIWTNVTSTLGNILEVNYTVTTPNGSVIIDNQNASSGGGNSGYWNSSTFTIGNLGVNSDIGTWEWSYNILDDNSFTRTKAGNFTITNNNPTWGIIADPTPINEDSGLNNNILTNNTLNSTWSDTEEPTYFNTAFITAQTGSSIVNCVIDSDNNVDCTTQANQSGTNVLTMHLMDTNGGNSSSQTISIDVNEVNDAPYGNIPDNETNEDISFTWNFTSYISDVDSQDSVPGSINISRVQLNDTSLATFSPNNNTLVIDVSPSANLSGTIVVNLSFVDREGTGLEHNVSGINFTINAVNDLPSVPTLNSPATETNYTSAQTLQWNNATDVEGSVVYRLEVDGNSDFSSPEYTNNTVGETAEPTSDTPTGLSDGLWYWQVRSRDNEGANSSYSSSRTFRIDTTAPTYASQGSSPSTIYSSTDVQVNATITDATTYVDSSRVILSSNETGSFVNSTPTQNGDEYYFDISNSNLEIGERVTWFFCANDSLNNANCDTERTFDVVNQPPVINENATLPSTPSWNDVTQIYANVTEQDSGDGISRVNFTVITPNSSVIINDVNGTLQAGTNYWNSSTFTIGSRGINSDIGTWTWTVNATDSNGGNTTDSGTFAISNQNPVISAVEDFSLDEDFGTYQLNLTANESDTEESGTNLNWNVSINDSSIVTVAVTDQAGDLFTFTSVANISGNVNVSLRLNDTLSGNDTSSFILTVNAVNDVPSIPILFSPENASTVGDSSPALQWQNSSDVEGDTITYGFQVSNDSRFLADNITYENSGTAEGGISCSGNICTRGNVLTTLADITYYWRVNASDGTNDSAYSNFWQFTVDGTIPSISDETQYPSDTELIIYMNTSVYVNATISDDNLDTVTLESNFTGSWANYTDGITNVSTNYTFLIDNGNWSNQQGVSWRYWANDSGNKIAIGTMQSFTIRNRNPSSCTYNAPANDSAQTSSTVTLSAIPSDDDADTVRVVFYGASAQNPTDEINTTTFRANGSTINFDWTGRSDGVTYYWKAVCQDDIGGNSSTIGDAPQRQFTISLPSNGNGDGGGGGGGGSSSRLNQSCTQDSNCIEGLVCLPINATSTKKTCQEKPPEVIVIGNLTNFTVVPPFLNVVIIPFEFLAKSFTTREQTLTSNFRIASCEDIQGDFECEITGGGSKAIVSLDIKRGNYFSKREQGQLKIEDVNGRIKSVNVNFQIYNPGLTIGNISFLYILIALLVGLAVYLIFFRKGKRKFIIFKKKAKSIRVFDPPPSGTPEQRK